MNMKRALRCLLPLGLATLVAACGGASDEDSGQPAVRLVNLTQDIASLDLATVDDEDETDTDVSALAMDSQSSYQRIGSDVDTLKVTRSGASTALITVATGALTDDTDYSLVAYGYEGAYQYALIADDVDDADDNETTFRVFNAAADAGDLDIYVTEQDVELGDASATVGDLGAGTLSGQATLDSGTYRLRVTAAGDKDDVRLDIDGLVLPSEGVVTLVLTPGVGGTLVHGHLLAQGGDLTLARNTAVRARVVASVASGAGAVAVSADGTALEGGLSSPAIGSYVLLPASGLAFDVTLDGTALTVPDFSAVAGADLTVLVHGPAGGGQVAVISDDNRLPTTSSKAKLRLVNGLGTDSGNLSLTLDYSAVGSNLAAGTASTPKLVTVGSDLLLEVTGGTSSPLYSDDEVALSANGVYTMFMLNGQGTPKGVLRAER